MPDIAWQLRVWAPDGTARPTITVDGSIAELTGFDVDGAGNCLEAEFLAVPSEVNIQARDVIQLEVSEDGGTTWEGVYKGVIVIAGAVRAADFRAYKAVGLKQRLYEIPLEEPVITGGDVSDMVDEALSSITLPTGVSYVDSTTYVPTQNFQLGDRYPRLESVGDFLDALAESVGGFIVPSGTTYTYDGVSYSAGATVPATRWGVDAAGLVFFQRPQASPVAAREDARNVLVTWDDTVAEEIYDGSVLIFASEYDGLPRPPAAHVIAFSHEAGSINSTRLVTLDHPMDFMKRGETDAVATRGTASYWLNLGNATDDSDATYAESDAPDNGDGTSDLAVLEVETHWPAESPGAIVRLLLAAGTFKQQNLSFGGDPIPIALEIDVTFAGVSVSRKLTFATSEGGLTEHELLLVLPPPASGVSTTHLVLEVWATRGSRVYEVQGWVVDEDSAGLLAESYLRAPQSDASSVTLVGQLGAVSQSLALTPVDESPVAVPVERIEYSLTEDRGLVTTYHAGQAYDPELLSQRAVLEGLSRRIARREARR